MRKAFTLLEVLILVVIIGSIVLVAVPSLAAIRTEGRGHEPSAQSQRDLSTDPLKRYYAAIGDGVIVPIDLRTAPRSRGNTENHAESDVESEERGKKKCQCH